MESNATNFFRIFDDGNGGKIFYREKVFRGGKKVFEGGEKNCSRKVATRAGSWKVAGESKFGVWQWGVVSGELLRTHHFPLRHSLLGFPVRIPGASPQRPHGCLIAAPKRY